MRTYLPADARCKQLERLVRDNPGLDVGALAAKAGIAFHSAHAYLRRLRREGRVVSTREDPEMSRGSTLRFYPPAVTAQRKVA